MRKVNLFNLNYNHEEQDAVREVLNSQWIAMGAKAEKFEREFSHFIGAECGVAVNSCTAALHLAVSILGIGPGDEVIVPSLTFAATVNCVLYVGGTPVFADVSSLGDWTISPEDIERRITPKTKAIIVMHYGGFGCDMKAIKDLADKRGLYLVEDASHAPGGVYQGMRLGSIGHMSCFSFYANKNLSTAEGGMLVTSNREYSEKARLFRSHGMTTSAHERNSGSEFYSVAGIGYNYRLDDIRSSLGLVQLRKLPGDIKMRNESAKRYKARLSSIDGVRAPFENYDGLSTYYIYPTLLENGERERVRKELDEMGVQTSIHYPPVHLFRHFKGAAESLSVTEEIGNRSFSLPIYGNMAAEDVDYVCDCLEKAVSRRRD